VLPVADASAGAAAVLVLVVVVGVGAALPADAGMVSVWPTFNLLVLVRLFAAIKSFRLTFSACAILERLSPFFTS
jgi:hypothetical protein